jgi:hypothetical protein
MRRRPGVRRRARGGSPALCITARPRLGCDVTSARLQLYAATTSQAGYAVRAVGVGGWSDGTITDSTAPAPGPVVATSGPVAHYT